MYIYKDGTHTDGEPLARDSHWWEVVWGVPDWRSVGRFVSAYFHPSHVAIDDRFGEACPEAAAWLDHHLPGRWRFVLREALYFNDKHRVYRERVLLFRSRDDAARFVETRAHDVVRSRIAHWEAASAGLAREQEERYRWNLAAQERAIADHREHVRIELARYEYMRTFDVDRGFWPPDQPRVSPPVVEAPRFTTTAFSAEREAAERLLALPPMELVPVLLRETPPLTSNVERWTQGGTFRTGTLYDSLIAGDIPGRRAAGGRHD